MLFLALNEVQMVKITPCHISHHQIEKLPPSKISYSFRFKWGKFPPSLNAIWKILIGVPQGFMLCFLFFLIYINNPSNYAVTPVKRFPDDILLFLIAQNAKNSTNELNSNLKSKSEWTYPWKMSFNLDLEK